MSRSGKEEKMSRKNGKKLLIAIVVRGIVAMAVRNVIKVKKQEKTTQKRLPLQSRHPS